MSIFCGSLLLWVVTWNLVMSLKLILFIAAFCVAWSTTTFSVYKILKFLAWYGMHFQFWHCILIHLLWAKCSDCVDCSRNSIPDHMLVISWNDEIEIPYLIVFRSDRNLRCTNIYGWTEQEVICWLNTRKYNRNQMPKAFKIVEQVLSGATFFWDWS